jgi:hypothetical protein
MKRLSIAACGIGIVLIANQCSAVIFPNIFDQSAGYWPFDETTGGIAHDASGAGQNGTLINYAGNQGNWTAGRIGGALDFGGLPVQQYVRVPDFTKPTTSLTVSSWVWADSLTQWGTITANWNGLYGALEYGLFGSNPQLSLYFAEPNPQGINVANGSESAALPSFSVGQWHYVAVVVNGSTHSVTFWRDGLNYGQFFFSGSFYPAPVPQLDIGGEPAGFSPSQSYWDGKIDDLALWTRALSNQEIAAIYNAGLNGQALSSLVPEPGSAALLGLGFVGLFLRRRRAP